MLRKFLLMHMVCEENFAMKINLRHVLVFILISSAIWGSNLELFYIPGIGSIYPLRIFLLIFLAFEFVAFFRIKGVVKKNDLATKTCICLFLFWLNMIIVTLFNEFQTFTISSIITYTMNLLLIVAVFFIVRDEDDRSVAMKTIILNSIVVMILALYETRNGVWLFRADLPTIYHVNDFGTITPVVIFYNTNNLCMFLCLSLIAFYLICNKFLLRAVYTFLVVYITLLTSCRTGLIAILFFFAIMFQKKYINTPIKKTIIYGSGIVISLAYVLYGNLPLANVRLQIWSNALYNCYQSHFLGVGAGRAATINSNFALYSAVNNRGLAIAAVHNYLLELLLENGIIGILLLCTGIGRYILIVWNNRKTNQGMFYLAMILVLLLTSVCVSSMTEYFQYWIFLGFIISFAREQSDCEYDEIG